MTHSTITEPAISDLVHQFYGKVREDDLISEIFNDTIGDNWEPHLATMVNFWSSVMLTSGAYKGNPAIKHNRLGGLKPEFFPRWLALFEETAKELFDASVAEAFTEKAHRIAASLQAHAMGVPQIKEL